VEVSVKVNVLGVPLLWVAVKFGVIGICHILSKYTIGII